MSAAAAVSADTISESGTALAPFDLTSSDEDEAQPGPPLVHEKT